MLIRKPGDVRNSEITPESIYRNRRAFMLGSAALVAATAAACKNGDATAAATPKPADAGGARKLDAKKSPLSTDEKQTTFEDVTGYNNFYEFGLDKTDPAKNAGTLRPRPWTVAVEGAVAKPGRIDMDDVLKQFTLEERVYRHRCVEAWSMVIPWIGFPLGDLLKRFEPTSNAKYVEFTTLKDTAQMPFQKSSALDWPYIEGLRIDEAMHPLAILGVGLYGQVMPNQNGAPIRLVTPWKYGFKGIKSIVKIRLVPEAPRNTWNVQAPGEYGFYANVNPEVDHPRWTQKKERRIGELSKRATLKFNGYGDQVASLYAGMDLAANY